MRKYHKTSEKGACVESKKESKNTPRIAKKYSKTLIREKEFQEFLLTLPKEERAIVDTYKPFKKTIIMRAYFELLKDKYPPLYPSELEVLYNNNLLYLYGDNIVNFNKIRLKLKMDKIGVIVTYVVAMKKIKCLSLKKGLEIYC